MKLTTLQILNASHSLNALMKMDLPACVGWPLQKNAKKLDEVLREFNDYRKKLVAKYTIPGEVDANCNPKLSDEAAFNTEMQDLLNQSNEVDIVQIEIGKLGAVSIPPSAFYTADFMFKD